jgi:hypothetical protein
LSNTTDLVYDITNSSESVNQWILMTHFEFLQNRSDAKMRKGFILRGATTFTKTTLTLMA